VTKTKTGKPRKANGLSVYELRRPYPRVAGSIPAAPTTPSKIVMVGSQVAGKAFNRKERKEKPQRTQKTHEDCKEKCTDCNEE